MSVPEIDITQLDELHAEYRKLIKNNGLKKAIIKLRSLNNNNEEESRNIDTYEQIIKAVIEVYGVTERQLYEDVGKFVATDARRSAYVLLNKHLKYTQQNIGVQFGKTREAVNWAMMEFGKMIKDESPVPAIVAFKKKHREAERLVEERISQSAIESDDDAKDSAKKPAPVKKDGKTSASRTIGAKKDKK